VHAHVGGVEKRQIIWKSGNPEGTVNVDLAMWINLQSPLGPRERE